MTANFYPGMRVVCVDDSQPPSDAWHFKNGIVFNLQVGKVYTVERVYYSFAFYHKELSDWQMLSLVEVKKPPSPGSDSDGFNALRFRPVVERKTDISIFHEMLITQTVGIPA